MLEKKEGVLLKKAAAEVEKAKEFTRAKNKRGIRYSSGFIILCYISIVFFFFFVIF